MATETYITKTDLTLVFEALDANHKAVMAALNSIAKSVGRSPNY